MKKTLLITSLLFLHWRPNLAQILPLSPHPLLFGLGFLFFIEIAIIGPNLYKKKSQHGPHPKLKTFFYRNTKADHKLSRT